MKAILDTHVFLWFNAGDPRLSVTALQIIRDGGNEIFLSAASAWEIAIKAARGKLTLPEPADKYIANRMSAYRFSPLPIQVIHAAAVFKLPEIHRDPFDRLLIVQSQLESIPLLTSDENIRKYPVVTIW